MYVKRNTAGNIIAISAEPADGYEEVKDPESPELISFLDQLDEGVAEARGEVERLRASDAELARVLEDIISLLTDKGVIQFTELPRAAQEKLLQRKSLRQNIARLDLLADDDNESMLP